jgi:hypothetical protein
MSMEDSIPELADAIFREKVLRARATPQSQKMGLGAKLYAESLGRMRSGIRMQFPDADTAEVERILAERLRRLTRLEEHDTFPHTDSLVES